MGELNGTFPSKQALKSWDRWSAHSGLRSSVLGIAFSSKIASSARHWAVLDSRGDSLRQRQLSSSCYVFAFPRSALLLSFSA